MTILEFIKAHRLQMEFLPADTNPNMDIHGWQASHWRILIRCNETRRVMRTFYSMGSAHTGDPSLPDVLDSLRSDSHSTVYAFEEWCREFGYDTDSRKAERTYNACCQSARSLRRMLGPSAYDELLNVEPS